MNICVISDSHDAYKDLEIPECDVLIHAGDINAYAYSSELKDFNRWLGTLPHKHKIVIAGNHDKYLYKNDINKVRQYLNNAIYLENSGCEIDGIKFWGSPITPTFNNWFFMAERGADINEYWKQIPKDTDVLITHGPPYKILDYVAFSYTNHHVGCNDLLRRVKEIKPKFHVFGHIHGSYGIHKENDITFVNASVMDEDYTIVNKPITIDIQK